MKRLKQYAKYEEPVTLIDYFGEQHQGQILMKTVDVSWQGFGKQENRYFFQRKDGAQIKITKKGLHRVVQEESGVLRLINRSPFTPKQFEEMRVA